ncbi:myotubularin-related protein 9 isoform X3 [Leuresthes tenuis]|uniref:myotubularin-related protein 9 isoform X3 n=1 Tax=Leuresthes tenuis TaxID=355514 RepID=UPI003B500D7A
MEFSEHIKTANVEDVELRQPLHPPSRGTLCITGHHLLFSDREEGSSRQVLLLLRNIDAIEKSVENLLGYTGFFSNAGHSERMSGSSGTITIKCKDLRVLQLDIPGMEQCLNIAHSIETLSCLDNVSEMYPFFYRPTDLNLQNHRGLSAMETYYGQTKELVIMRSSQPLTGANRKRCKEDELLLQAVIDGSDKGYIIDTRSSQQVQQARMMGGGFESKSCYDGWKRLHRQMEKGKALQESLIKLVEACRDESHNMDRWLSKLENSKWLSHVQTALSTAGLLAECVERDGHSALVHGSEGTDCSLLISTLAQLIMDPCCRTLEGFLGLLEREWVEAGHPFQQRCAHSAYSHARLQQESPVFLLLLDCVWQLWRQFPLALGFSEALLLRLATEVYASDYGTFLCNSDQERSALGVKEKTYCLFQALLRPTERDIYSNPLYEPTELAIWPSVHPQSLQLWKSFFLRWTPQTRHLEEVQEEIRNMVIEWGKLALN